MRDEFLRPTIKIFALYKSLGELAMAQLSDADLHWQLNEDTNSIAMNVHHLWGNMRSRWIDFLTSDGEKPWRERDAEFEPFAADRAAIMQRWEEGWACLFAALEALEADDLHRTVYIRGEAHTVTEAIQRQVAHYAYHVGQMVQLGKMIRGGEWVSLSIPKKR
ncbi:MAG: DUF1572 domain-containing protein [Bacteroidetes bacterium]|nr:DUF1572 domain-containing protein [Bacteroidota bacterium]